MRETSQHKINFQRSWSRRVLATWEETMHTRCVLAITFCRWLHAELWILPFARCAGERDGGCAFKSSRSHGYPVAPSWNLFLMKWRLGLVYTNVLIHIHLSGCCFTQLFQVLLYSWGSHQASLHFAHFVLYARQWNIYWASPKPYMHFY